MKSTVLWSLIVLNAVLLTSFVWRLMPENRAMGQRAPMVAPLVPRTGDYLMLPTEVNGAPSGVVVILDQTNALLSAMSYDETNQKIETMSKVDLRTVFQPAMPAPARGAR